jgi:SAM-dependent methyltransferase
MLIEGKLHSVEVLGDWRDEWWDPEFLQLMARRLQLAEVGSALDVGAGRGHWGRTLLPHLHPKAELTGLDREAAWVAEAAATPGANPMQFVEGLAEALPFADDSFDMVTCQTVLMHVADPQVVVSEFFRVLKPGGLVLLSEPCNLANTLIRDSVTSAFSPQRVARMAEFHATSSAGRCALGEGDDSVGDRLPVLLAASGFGRARLHQNDRLLPMLAPYTEAMNQALNPFPKLVRERAWLFGEAYAWRLFQAGGGTRERFDVVHSEFVSQGDETLAQIAAETYWSPSGHNHYLASARKP